MLSACMFARGRTDSKYTDMQRSSERVSGMSASMPCVQVCSPSRHGHVQGNVGAACGKVDSSRAVRGGHLGRASGQDPP